MMTIPWWGLLVVAFAPSVVVTVALVAAGELRAYRRRRYWRRHWSELEAQFPLDIQAYREMEGR